MLLIMSPYSSCFDSMSLSSSIPIMTTHDTHMPLASVGSIVTPNMTLSLSLSLSLSCLSYLETRIKSCFCWSVM